MEHMKEAISKDVTYKLLETNNPIPVVLPSHLLRNDIQSLRALAIFFVLLFHMWPSKVKFGYLGVDMFFVISGYLIFMLLSRKRPINGSKTLNFYFRRIKRIVPIYLFIVGCVLFSVYHLLAPIEFTQVVDETLPALGFYSNMPGTRPFKYFDLSSKLFFFLHTWSLSVEMQFYLTVPILFFALEYVDKVRPVFKYFLISIIPLSSFIYQTFSTGDSSHMLLIARFWQFFAGFFAYYSFENYWLNFVKNENTETSRKQILDEIVSLAACALLCLLFLFGSNIHTQLNRLLVILLAALIVGRDNESSPILNNRFLVVIGDASYSIYLIHWSLFTWHRYENMSMYVNGHEADFITGSTLIVISVVAGFLVEKMFKYILRYIDGWSFLIAFLFFGYWVNAILVYQLHSNAVDLNEGLPKHKISEWEAKVRSDTIRLWNQRDDMPTYTRKEINDFNLEFIHAVTLFSFCDNKDKKMPTHFNLNLHSYSYGSTYTCHAKGNGTKNIVIVGNSHGMHNFPGIAYIFRNIYKTLTLFVRNSCIPAARQFQEPPLPNKTKDECVRFLDGTIKSLQQWKEPIDVVIALYAFFEITIRPPAEDLDTDEFFKSLQSSFSALGKIPREALIMYDNFPLFQPNPINEVFARIKSGKPLNVIGSTKKKMMKLFPESRTRIGHIHCDKCIKIKFIDKWCPAGEDGFCHAVQEQGLIYFSDISHPSVFGSFYNAQVMLKRYKEFTNK